LIEVNLYAYHIFNQCFYDAVCNDNEEVEKEKEIEPTDEKE